jgi:hypothetical protein
MDSFIVYSTFHIILSRDARVQIINVCQHHPPVREQPFLPLVII